MKKRIVSIVLITVFLLATIVTAGFAAMKDDRYAGYGAKGGYLSIGDSITRGLGAEGADTQSEIVDNYMAFKTKRYIDGAYNYQIAQITGCFVPLEVSKTVGGNFYNVALPAQTLRATNNLYGIASDYEDQSGYSMEYEEDLNSLYGRDGAGGDVLDLTRNVSLITVQVGMTDVFYSTFTTLTEGGSLVSGGTISVTKLYAALNALQSGYDYFSSHFERLIDTMVVNNENNVKIIVVGAFNPLSGVNLDIIADYDADIGLLFDFCTAGMNETMQNVAAKYDNVYFADVSDTKTLAGEQGSSLEDYTDLNISFLTHPSQNGYNNITNKILSVLPECSFVETEPRVKEESVVNSIDGDTDKTENVLSTFLNKFKTIRGSNTNPTTGTFEAEYVTIQFLVVFCSVLVTSCSVLLIVKTYRSGKER